MTISIDATPEPDGLRPFSVSIWSNLALQALTPYLCDAGRQSGLQLDIMYGACKPLLTGAQNEKKPAIAPDAGMVLVWFWLPAYSSVLTGQFAHHGADKIAWELERIKFACSSMLKTIRTLTSAPLLWLGFEPISYPVYGIADAEIGQRELIRQLNLFVAGELQSIGQAWFLDTALCLERIGAESFYDWNGRASAQMPISTDGIAAVAAEVAKYLRALTGTTRKCLVLDADNTLWGGILGEDGMDGIQIGKNDSGCRYQDFQAEVLNLYHRGVILALCSKNNEDDVLAVLRNHPGMLLREDHFATMKINWQDKPANIRDIANELNIGLDSMVFVDDSPFEIECVQMALPDVAVLHVAPGYPGGHARQLVHGGLFDVLTVTEEDKHRGAMYRAEGQRKAFKDGLTEIENHFGKHFEIKMERFVPVGDELNRAAQLCQRTNQFNLTISRYTRDELEKMTAPEYIVQGLRVSDRFGDCGMVGLAIVRITGDEGEIITFLLSCRALSRGIEAAFLGDILAALPCRRVIGRYVPAKKNQQTATFYLKNGFLPLRKDADGEWFIRESKSDRSAVNGQ